MNITDKNQKNMLHYAAMSGNVATCKYLVERVGLSPLSWRHQSFDIRMKSRMRTNFFDLEEYFQEETGAPLEKCITIRFVPECIRPSIVRVGEDYYMVNSSFIYYPCIPVSTSKV